MGLFCKVQSAPGHFKKNILILPPLPVIFFFHSLKSISRLFLDSQMKVRLTVLSEQNGLVTAILQNSVQEKALKEFLGGGTVKCRHSLLNLHCSLRSLCKRAVSHCGCTFFSGLDASSRGVGAGREALYSLKTILLLK